MMKRLYTITYSFLAATLLLSMQSCIKEDLSDCPSDVRIYFDYREGSYGPNGSAQEGINPSNVGPLYLYVFNAEGTFIAEYRDLAPRMSKEYYMTIPEGLETGSYQFVVWSGEQSLYKISETLIPEQTQKQNLRLELQGIQQDTTRAKLTPLFYATHRKGIVEVKRGAYQRDTLNLVQDTYKINVTIDGVKPESSDSYYISVEDTNGKYTFDNNISSQGSKFNYISSCTKSEEKRKASITVLRLLENRSPILRVQNQSQQHTIFEKNLVELLMLIETVGGKVDFSYMHEFNIEIRVVDEINMECEVIINGWKVIEQGSSIGGE